MTFFKPGSLLAFRTTCFVFQSTPKHTLNKSNFISKEKFSVNKFNLSIQLINTKLEITREIENMKLFSTSLIKNICSIRGIHASRANFSIMASNSQGRQSNSSTSDACNKLTPEKLESGNINTRTILKTNKVTSYEGKRFAEFTDDEKAEFIQMKIDEYHTELTPEVVEKNWNSLMVCKSYSQFDKTLK